MIWYSALSKKLKYFSWWRLCWCRSPWERQKPIDHHILKRPRTVKQPEGAARKISAIMVAFFIAANRCPMRNNLRKEILAWSHTKVIVPHGDDGREGMASEAKLQETGHSVAMVRKQGEECCCPSHFLLSLRSRHHGCCQPHSCRSSLLYFSLSGNIVLDTPGDVFPWWS